MRQKRKNTAMLLCIAQECLDARTIHKLGKPWLDPLESDVLVAPSGLGVNATDLTCMRPEWLHQHLFHARYLKLQMLGFSSDLRSLPISAFSPHPLAEESKRLQLVHSFAESFGASPHWLADLPPPSPLLKLLVGELMQERPMQAADLPSAALVTPGMMGADHQMMPPPMMHQMMPIPGPALGPMPARAAHGRMPYHNGPMIPQMQFFQPELWPRPAHPEAEVRGHVYNLYAHMPLHNDDEPDPDDDYD